MNGMEWKGRERKRREGKGKEGKGREGVYKFINSGQAVAVLLFIDYWLEKFKWINKKCLLKEWRNSIIWLATRYTKANSLPD